MRTTRPVVISMRLPAESGNRLQRMANRHDPGCVYQAFLIPKLVTNSSPKLCHLGVFLSRPEPEKQDRQRDLAF